MVVIDEVVMTSYLFREGAGEGKGGRGRGEREREREYVPYTIGAGYVLIRINLVGWAFGFK